MALAVCYSGAVPHIRLRLKYQKFQGTFFATPGSKKAMKRYWEVPASVIENQRMLMDWALEAIEVRRAEK
jgi:DNA transformation protein and related proteins